MYCSNVDYKVALAVKELIMRQCISKIIHITITAEEINAIRIFHVYQKYSDNDNDERYNVFNAIHKASRVGLIVSLYGCF